MLQKIKKWLGITALEERNIKLLQRQKELEDLISTLSSGIVDVHFKTPSQIYIVSKLGDGYFTHIDANCSYETLIDFAKEVKQRFGNPKMIWDNPSACRQMAKQMRIERGL